MLPERLRELRVEIDGIASGQLLKHSIYEYRYAQPDDSQPAVSLLMPPSRPTWQDGDLFPSMDQNLPEGDLFLRLRQLYPKQALTPMHLLALIGRNGIGRLGFALPDAPALPPGTPISRAALLSTRWAPEVFDELVAAYLSTGAGVAGMQPKIMVPDRPSVPVPNLIVKAASPAYPGLAANEFLCLTAARRAGIEVPGFDLSADGQVLVVDRFDITAAERRLGFEDMAALMGLRVRDVLADRKYQGSYERIVELMRYLRLPQPEIERFFEQLAFSVAVRNGDAHLKNFGILYGESLEPRLAPMFDVVTTAIYRFQRYPGGPEMEDRTMALKLFAGRGGSRAYPTTEELLQFGRKVCRVGKPEWVVERIAQALSETLSEAQGDTRCPAALRASMAAAWSGATALDPMPGA